MESMVMDDLAPIFSGKKVLVTGHTGFKGSWLAIWLSQLGAKVSGFSLNPPTNPNNFDVSNVASLMDNHHIGDIRNLELMKKIVSEEGADIIFHMAAQPIVSDGYKDPIGTFDTNIMGTANLLEAVRHSGKPAVVVVISSDKCYENKEHVWGYRECDALGGFDPYSASKGGTEIVVSSYRNSFFNPMNFKQHGVSLASARAGNVLGGGDWANDRIMTDIIACLEAGEPIKLRNPNAIRPWQHVLEPLSGYLTLAAKLLENPDSDLCSAWNFGPQSDSTVSVKNIAELAIDIWGSGAWNDVSNSKTYHEASILRLAID
ncbi:MAG: CDP-glucose 4,6-dehydratase, partial [Hyphomicrobiales bacterium]